MVLGHGLIGGRTYTMTDSLTQSFTGRLIDQVPARPLGGAGKNVPVPLVSTCLYFTLFLIAGRWEATLYDIRW